MARNLGEPYYDHFVKFFGAPISAQIVKSDDEDFRIQVLAFDNVFPACRVFCTLGLTHYSTELNTVAEVYLSIDSGWNDAPYIVGEISNYMVKKSLSLGRGSSISGLQNILPPFVEAFRKDALYFTMPYDLPDGFSTIKLSHNTGYIYLAAFITQAEYDFLVQNGPEQFENLLEAKQVDLYNLARPSSI